MGAATESRTFHNGRIKQGSPAVRGSRFDSKGLRVHQGTARRLMATMMMMMMMVT